MGPYGSCKTTYGVMLACNAAERAKQLSATAAEDGSSTILLFLLSYEARVENELRLRAVGYSAQILRTVLEHMGSGGVASLSTNKKTRFVQGLRKEHPD